MLNTPHLAPLLLRLLVSGLMDNGFKYIMQSGDVLENNYPYTAHTGSCTKSKTSPIAVKLDGFKDVAKDDEKQLQVWRGISTNGEGCDTYI